MRKGEHVVPSLFVGWSTVFEKEPAQSMESPVVLIQPIIVTPSYAAGSEVVAVPEPSTLTLAALGLLGLGIYRWRRRSRRQ